MQTPPRNRLPLSLLAAAALVAVGCQGRDVPTASPKAAGAATLTTAPSDLDLAEAAGTGVRSYTVTLPVASETGTISQSIEASWDATLHAPQQPPVFPQGWTLDYYAGTTKLSAPPASASDWASISRLVASGSAFVEGADGNRQALKSSITAPPVQVAASFQGGSAGDGWDMFFDPSYKHVFNIHHHSSPATVMCRNLSDSSTCPGFPIGLTATSYRATGIIDEISNKLWQPTVASDNHLAWDCVDLTTAARCATPVIESLATAPSTDYNSHMEPVQVGRKLYALGINASGQAIVTCLDMSTATECNGASLGEGADIVTWGLDAIGTRLYANARSGGHLQCFDSKTMAACGGAFPLLTSTGGRVHAVPSADGSLNNICVDWQCWKADGTATTTGANYRTYAQAHPGASLTNAAYFANASHLGTRVAWVSDINQVQCWDMATDTSCSGAMPFGVQSVYATKLDPVDPDCIWTNGDDGIIRNFRISTGAAGCSGGPPKIAFKASVSIPRLGCDPATRVYQYKSFQMSVPAPGQYTSASLTVINSNGAVVPGWSNVPLDGTGSADISALSPSDTGSTPTFTVAAPGFSDTTVSPQASFRVTTDATPQLCFDLYSPAPTCPSTAGLAGTATGTSSSSAVAAKGAYVKPDNSVVNYTDQSVSDTLSIDPANMTNCGATVTAVVQDTNGNFVAGVPIALLDASGSAVTDGNGQAVVVASAADGTVKFGVWPTSYRLRITGSVSVSPASMTVTAGGSGTTNASANTVTSNAFTTTHTVSAAVAVVMNLTPPPAPALTGPAAASSQTNHAVSFTGTCADTSTVTVREGSTGLCTKACSAGAFSCTATLSSGHHAITAVASWSGLTSTPSAALTFDVLPAAPTLSSPVEAAVTRQASLSLSGACESGDAVLLSEGSSILCTVTCAQGAFSCGSRTFAEGPHAIQVRQTEPGGVSSFATVRNFTVDVTVPVAPTLLAPTEGTATNDVTPSFSGQCESGASVTVLEGAASLCTTTCVAGAYDCTSAILTEGPHSVTAVQTDAAGNVGPASSVRGFVVLVTPPAAPALTAPVAGSSTSNHSPGFSGTCITGSQVAVFEGSTQLCTTTCASGLFACQGPALVDALHTVTAKQTDAAGNTSQASGAIAFTVDTTLPVSPKLTSPASGTSLANRTPTVAGTCESGAQVDVVEGAQLLCSATCAQGAFSCTTGTLGEGPHTLVAHQTDTAGNRSPDGDGLLLSVDVTAPGLVAFTAPAEGLATHDVTPAFSGTCETGASVAVVEGASVLCTASCTAGSFSCKSAPLAEGSHVATAHQTDAAGNTSADSAPRSLLVIVTPPAAPGLTAPVAGSFLGNRSPTFTGTCQTGATVTVSEGALSLCTAACVASAFSCESAALIDASHTVTATQTDIAGNQSGVSATRTFVVDTTLPVSPKLGSPVGGTSLSNRTPTVSGTCETEAQVAVYDGATLLCSSPCSAGAFSCTTTALDEGAHTLVLRQTDRAGNQSASSDGSLLLIDLTAPTAVVVRAPVEGAVTANTTPHVTGSCEPYAAVRVVEGSAELCATVCEVTGMFVCTSAELADGVHHVTALQSDGAGNTSAVSEARSFRVDTIAPAAPTVTGPLASVSVSSSTPAISGACEDGAHVTVYEQSTALCDTTCSGGKYTCASLALTDGVHGVYAVQVDVAGNQSAHGEPRSFTVDTGAPKAPAIVRPFKGQHDYDARTAFSGTAEAGSTVTVSVGGAVACTATAGAQGAWSCTAVVAAGPATAVATATDAAGNTSVSAAVGFTQYHSVADPKVTSPKPGDRLQGPRVTVDGTGSPGSTVDVMDESGKAICSASVQSDGSWSCSGELPVGAHTLVATGSAGTLSSGSSAPVALSMTGSASLTGGGCSSTGPDATPMALVFFAAAALWRRRRTAQ